jgi:streptogrisin C
VNGNRTLRAILAVAAAATLGIATAGPARAQEPAPDRPVNQAAADVSLLAALQRDLHLTPAEAKRLLAKQAQVDTLEKSMSAKLGAAFGGSWFNQRTGKLVVTATTAERAATARSERTETRVVKRSLDALSTIKNNLDVAGKRNPKALAAANSWAIDVEHNQVVVTARKGQTAALSSLVARYGDAVRIEESAVNPVITADYLDGGDPYNGCSVGFNVTRGNVGLFLTAGHCGTAGQNAQQGGVTIGPFEQSYFPDYDDALVRNDNPGYWSQGPWVFAYSGDPGVVYNISGYRDSPVGTAVCKSGRTTGLTCGTVTVKDETINVSDGNGNPLGAVHGLTRHSACVEQGDSGGSNISVTSAGNFAEGMTSAANLSPDASGRLRCQSYFGRTNVSYFFPIADSLAFYGVTLTTL